MDLCVVGDTISEIIARMSFLRDYGDTSSSIIQNIERHLLKIEGVIAKLDQNNTPQNWKGQVTDVVTDLFDLLEDLDLPADAALFQKRSIHTKITSFLPFWKHTRHSLLLKLEQFEKRLRDVAADTSKLSLNNVPKLKSLDAEEPEIKFVGRQQEKKIIIEQILSKEKVEEAVRVVTIVGIPGMGKTELAKFVRDDKTVKSAFDLVIWIDGIHDEFYAEFVVNRLIHESAKKKNKEKMKKLEEKDSVVMDQNLSLGEAKCESRFFLVLDDFRNENPEEWLNLHRMLKEAAGGAVLITTQSPIVADFVDSYTLHLKKLSETVSLSLFQQIAGEGPSDSSIRDAKEKMVKMCCGIPVAILTMARLLRSRKANTESEIYQLKDQFLQEMKLIYYDKLPSWRLKQCFVYSSFIFSKPGKASSTRRAKAKPETLIKLWMAEGFLGPLYSSSTQQPEDLGLECIQEFCRKSIFDTKENEYGVLESCLMFNDLMLELSAFVARQAGHVSLPTDNPAKDVKERICRLSLNVSNGIPKSLFKTNKRLRTIHFPASKDSRVPFEVKLSSTACEAIFSGFKTLRVLNLRDLGMKILPSSVGELKSLRYLELSQNNMEKLPNSIGELKHLQTLILSHCHQLKKLPNDLNHFVSLRHLEVDECHNLTHMPSALTKLTWLRTLSHFVVSTSYNHNDTGGLGELINLNNLRGELEISHLERLKFKELDEDRPDYMKKKELLEWLTLRWNHDEEDGESHNTGKHGHSLNYLRNKKHLQCLTLRRNHDDEDHNDDQNIDYDLISLEHLQPHPNLKGLSIVGYEGIKFSNWLSTLKNLVQFSLYNCSKCEFLPPLYQFPKLKTLQLRRLDSLKSITYDDGHNNRQLPAAPKFFESLKELRISDCPNLTSLWRGGTVDNAKPSSFPSISVLQVQYCPKLDCMPLFPDLDEELVLRCSNMKPLLETLKDRSNSWRPPGSASDYSAPLSKLKKLTIANMEEQSCQPKDWLKNFTSLEKLEIRKWSESLPEGIEHLISLNDLKIQSCPELTALKEGICDLKSLTSLKIYECHKLASLPQGMSKLESLKELSIRNCPLLLPRCQEQTGDDWPKIEHIKKLSVKFTSQYYD